MLTESTLVTKSEPMHLIKKKGAGLATSAHARFAELNSRFVLLL